MSAIGTLRLLLLRLLLASFSKGIHAAAPEQLTSCLNSSQSLSAQYSSQARALADEMSPLPVAGAWWSRRPPAVPVTIVTQLSFDRLEQLEAQCRSWPGPISAVAYMALDYNSGGNPKHYARAAKQELAPNTPEALLVEATEVVSRFHARAEDEMPCQLDLMLAYEGFIDGNSSLLYPINILRNYARLQARTPLIALFDVDMLPSKTMFHELEDPARLQWYFEQVKASAGKTPALLVFPAFTSFSAVTRERRKFVSAELVADSMVSAHKQQLTVMWRKALIKRFNPGTAGHLPTDFPRWLATDEAYEVQFQLHYEPWVLCDRMAVPWYDPRFRGYGKNKISNLEQMNHTGFRFVVHPTAWLVHRPHIRTEASRRHENHKKRSRRNDLTPGTMFEHNNRLYDQISAQLDGGTYAVVLDPPTHVCAAKLPWWI